MDERNKAKLSVGGVEYSGWTELSVTRSIEAISGKFTVSLTERWEEGSEPWPIVPGDRCTLKLGQDLVIDGYVDGIAPSYTASSHSITISGRDITADLVDCSCMLAPDQFSGVTLGQLVNRIVASFGIKVRDDSGSSEKFTRFKIQQGETAFEAIDRACRQRGVLPISLPGSGLVLRRSDAHARADTSPLIQGQNIKGGSAKLSIVERFSEYVVRGQRETSDIDDADVQAKATDANIGRYRPMLVVMSSGSNTTVAQKRAEWEAAVRAARSATASISVQGWRRADGALWEPGLLVPVRSQWLRLNGEYLVKTVTLRLSGSAGTVADLEVTSPNAFIPEPEIPKKKTGGRRSGKSSGGGVAWDLFEITEVNT